MDDEQDTTDYEATEVEPARDDERHRFVLAISPPSCRHPDDLRLSSDDLKVRRGDDGQWAVVVERDSPSFKEALFSALCDVRAAGLETRRVEPDDLVTQAEIAERLGRTSESVRLLSSGRRRKGTFPQSVVRTINRGSLWRWSEVAIWAKRPKEEIERAEWIAVVNTELYRARYTTPEKEAILQEVAEAIGGQRPRLPPMLSTVPRIFIADPLGGVRVSA